MPHNIDIEVGRRVMNLRVACGVTQKELARGIGVSFQQVQKYETGANRVSASKLVAIADHLGTTASAILDGLSSKTSAPVAQSDNTAVRLMKIYQHLPPHARKTTMAVARALAGQS